MFDLSVLLELIPGISAAIPRTFGLAALILILSITVGLIMTLIEIYRIPVLSQIVYVLKVCLRGTPAIVLIFLTYFGLPVFVRFFTELVDIPYNPSYASPIIMIIVALTLLLSPFQSETIKGAFRSVEPGQVIAAHSLGYSFVQSLRRIILPQAFEVALPELTSSFLICLKGLSLGFLITVVDIFGKAQLMAADTSNYVLAFLVAALLYWFIAFIVTHMAGRFEKRYKLRGTR